MMTFDTLLDGWEGGSESKLKILLATSLIIGMQHATSITEM